LLEAVIEGAFIGPVHGQDLASDIDFQQTAPTAKTFSHGALDDAKLFGGKMTVSHFGIVDGLTFLISLGWGLMICFSAAWVRRHWRWFCAGYAALSFVLMLWLAYILAN
jgi:hypothetical protein